MIDFYRYVSVSWGVLFRGLQIEGLLLTKFIKSIKSHNIPRQFQLHALHTFWTLISRVGVQWAKGVGNRQAIDSYIAKNWYINSITTLKSCNAYLGSVVFKTQWFFSSPKNCTPSNPYRDMKNRKNNVTLYICWLDRLKTNTAINYVWLCDKNEQSKIYLLKYLVNPRLWHREFEEDS